MANAHSNTEPLETVEGTLERIIYSNEENHYTVAQLLPEGAADGAPAIVSSLAARVVA